MTANGLAKLIEECGELVQVAGKKLAYFTTNDHPDGGAPLNRRLEDEIADVIAACNFVAESIGLDRPRIYDRAGRKVVQFHEWHALPDNNVHGLQLPQPEADKGVSNG
jgi:NTP pyrophosphatase (non-canonical NTP hydrolase)